MPVYLIAGMAATGKTTIGNALSERGYDTVDADDFGYFGNVSACTPVTYPKRMTREWLADNGWVWDLRAIRELLAQPHETLLFVCGGARNEHVFYRHFDRIFLLHVPDDVLRQRLRERDVPHTNNDIVLKQMLLRNRSVETQARNIGAIVIKTDKPVDACVEEILRHVG